MYIISQYRVGRDSFSVKPEDGIEWECQNQWECIVSFISCFKYHRIVKTIKIEEVTIATISTLKGKSICKVKSLN